MLQALLAQTFQAFVPEIIPGQPDAPTKSIAQHNNDALTRQRQRWGNLR